MVEGGRGGAVEATEKGGCEEGGQRQRRGSRQLIWDWRGRG